MADVSVPDIAENLKVIKDEIKAISKEEQKGKISIVAASKTKSKNLIVEAYRNGVRDFGENYVREVVEKANDPFILENCPDIKWHFIGHLQTNKASMLLSCPNIYMIQTIDTIKLANAVQKECMKRELPGHLKVMIQVNTSQEESKSGIAVDQVDSLVKHILVSCANLDLCGFMTIGSPNYNADLGPNPDYTILIEIRDRVSASYNLKDLHLSMGMSKDYLDAIQFGSTFVRIGEKIFGLREKKGS